MSKGLKKGRLSPLGAALAAQQLGRFAQKGKVDRPARPNAAKLAEMAGDLGTAASPLSNATRAEHYRTQRAGGKAKFCAQLTPKQAKRLRKKSRASLPERASAALAGAFDNSPKRATLVDAQLAVYARGMTR